MLSQCVEQGYCGIKHNTYIRTTRPPRSSTGILRVRAYRKILPSKANLPFLTIPKTIDNAVKGVLCPILRGFHSSGVRMPVDSTDNEVFG